MQKSETLLVQIVDRNSGEALTPVTERVFDRKPNEPEYLFIQRFKDIIGSETSQKIAYMPIMRRKLCDRNWAVDCVLL